MGKRKRQRRNRARRGTRRPIPPPRSTLTSETTPKAGGGRRLRRWSAIGVIAAVFLLAGVGAQRLLLSPRTSLALLPDPDISAAEAPVAEKIRALHRNVRRHPRSAAAWGKLAMNLDVHGFPEAVQTYKQAASLDPDDFRWVYYLAIVQQGLLSPEAAEWFERSKSLRPDYLPMLVRYGQALADIGLLGDASDAFRQALSVNPESSHAYLELAKIALLQGDLPTSQEHLVRALDISPQYGQVHQLLAEVYRRRNRSVEADRELRKARQLTYELSLPDTVFVDLMREGVSSYWYLRRGRAYVKARMYDAAHREFQQAVKVRPDAETHTSLAHVLQQSRKIDEAQEHYRAALALRPTYREALMGLGSVLSEMGQLQQAIAYFAQAKELNPDEPDAYLGLGILHERSGNEARAIDEFRQGLGNAREDYHLASQLARLLAISSSPQLRNGAEAVRLAETASAITSHRDPETLDVLAAAYAENGQFETAVETARRAHELAISAGRPYLAAQIEGRLESYRARRPIRSR